jgi:hypothetical protein
MIFRLLIVAHLSICGIFAAETENIHQRRVRENGVGADVYDVIQAVQEEIDVFRIRNLGSLSAPTKPVVSPTVKPPTPVYAPAVRRRMTATTEYDVFDAIQEEMNLFRNLGSLSVPAPKPVAAPQKPVTPVAAPKPVTPVAPPKPVSSPTL